MVLSRSSIKTWAVVLFNFLIITAFFDLILARVYPVRKNNVIRCQSPQYHHGLIPMTCGYQEWGRRYKVCTNSLGFMDEQPRAVDLKRKSHRIVFIGDSFTEGVGCEYKETFAGIIDKSLKERGIEVFNAGVSSYSPRLHLLKTRHLIESGFEFNELYVFIDISDPQDELDYKTFEPVVSTLDGFLMNVTGYLLRNSFLSQTAFNVFEKYCESSPDPSIWADKSQARAVAGLWTFDQREYEKWAQKGLMLAHGHMDALYKLCTEHGIKLSVAVYPWPEQIRNRDIGSRQVAFWKGFCESRNISFINFFPDFISNGLDENATIEKFFIKGDIHWNSEGHRIVADRLLGIMLHGR